MAKYETKSVEVDAIEASEVLKLVKSDWNALPQWLRDAYDRDGVEFNHSRISIAGTTNACVYDRGPSDFIVCDSSGHITTMHPEEFSKKFVVKAPSSAESPSHDPPTDIYKWDQALAHLTSCEQAYASIPTGCFALHAVINPLRFRYDSGERTQALIDEIMEVSL